jgi:Flp pilus assembly CpaF family ATPase
VFQHPRGPLSYTCTFAQLFLLNCLAAAIPARERVVTCEEVFELHVPLPDVVAMQTRQANLEGTGEITLRQLVKEALRMRPSRMIVGEVRQQEALDLLIALNSGSSGLAGTPTAAMWLPRSSIGYPGANDERVSTA